jgi:hypothetical protein
MRPVVLIRDRDEVAVSRPAFIFTTKLLELSASQRILTEVQQCCASHERSYQNSCMTAQLAVRKLLDVWLYFTKTVRLKAYTLIKLFVVGGRCATYAFTSLYYAYIVFNVR